MKKIKTKTPTQILSKVAMGKTADDLSKYLNKTVTVKEALKAIEIFGKQQKNEGFRQACELIDGMYSGCSTHPYLLGDCAMAKVGLMDKPHKNKYHVKLEQKHGR